MAFVMIMQIVILGISAVKQLDLLRRKDAISGRFPELHEGPNGGGHLDRVLGAVALLSQNQLSLPVVAFVVLLVGGFLKGDRRIITVIRNSSGWLGWRSMTTGSR